MKITPETLAIIGVALGTVVLSYGVYRSVRSTIQAFKSHEPKPTPAPEPTPTPEKPETSQPDPLDDLFDDSLDLGSS